MPHVDKLKAQANLLHGKVHRPLISANRRGFDTIKLPRNMDLENP